MGQSHRIANQVFNEFLASRALFTTDDLHKEILKRDGILRIGICYTVKDHKETLLNKGLIKLVRPEGKEGFFYQATEAFSNLIKANPAVIENGQNALNLICLIELKTLLDMSTCDLT